ncbi:cysteine desulfurase family protein [Longispora albida]|uniref:cysteine desulfurase family protein n=1 Tax=Longispora albida TaxID=203523 RepID=UPI0003643F79|nr:aminotransferase class V-fold PLP-dependent enzyme [Longispora albida]
MSASYLDAASAAPLHPVAREALLAALADGWADPARLYAQARRARQLLDASRATIADCLGARADEITFCASGTQAAHLAIAGARKGRRLRKVVHSAVEHSAVLHAAAEDEHAEVPVDILGRADLGAFAAALTPDTALAALMHANHEVGTVQPLAEAAALCAEHDIPLYTDAAQSLGRLPVPPGWSVLTGSAHKWGGPPGVGLLIVKKGTRWRRPGPSDEREPGRDLPAIVAAAASLRAVQAESETENARQSALVGRIRATVAAEIPDVEVIGDPDGRLPHIVTFSFLYVEGETLLHELDRQGFAVNSGSSCTSSTLHPSHVLAAMGVLTHGNVRVSVHRDTTGAEVDRLLAALPPTVARLRKEAGL